MLSAHRMNFAKKKKSSREGEQYQLIDMQIDRRLAVLLLASDKHADEVAFLSGTWHMS